MKNIFIMAENEEAFQRLCRFLSPHILDDDCTLRWVGSFDEATEEGMSDEDIFLTGMEEVLDQLLKEEDEDNKKPCKLYTGEAAVGVVRDMIRNNYMKAYSAREYAQHVNLSITYLCRTFRRINGISIGDYILKTRMEKAGDLLIHTNLKVREIGEIVGYSNFSYFCKRFKAFHHVSPNEYRHNVRVGGGSFEVIE